MDGEARETDVTTEITTDVKTEVKTEVKSLTLPKNTKTCSSFSCFSSKNGYYW